MFIITKELVLKAIELARPSAEKILQTEECVWGPRWVSGLVRVPNLNGYVPFTFGSTEIWNKELWGEPEHFEEIALKKMQVLERTGEDTSIVVAVYPWVLEKDEYLYPGGVSRFSISGATSGAMGRADEAISSIVVDCVIMLAHLEADSRTSDEDKHI